MAEALLTLANHQGPYELPCVDDKPSEEKVFLNDRQVRELFGGSNKLRFVSGYYPSLSKRKETQYSRQSPGVEYVLGGLGTLVQIPTSQPGPNLLRGYSCYVLCLAWLDILLSIPQKMFL